MHSHPNAHLTPRGRARVFAAVEAGMTVSAACIAFRVSRRCYYRWLPRWQAQGRAGLIDRSSRPHRSPQRLSLAQEAAIVALRTQTARGADFLAALLGLPASTVHRVIRRQGLLRQRAERGPVVRYEYSQAGAMVHIDTKKLGRIVGGPGHRIHGDHSRENRGVGWEVMHMAIDDASRLVYAEILGDETGRTTALFLIRAVRWFRAQGITVDRVLTDNGSPYRSKAWRRVCRSAGLRHRRTRPYHPQTNGKAERWIQTALRECLYLEVFNSSGQREAGLQQFIQWYNLHRPHRAHKGLSPSARLAQLQAA
ncbi:MAG TPA: IS481 family transposase [Candidatus Dormibacteraeota bacterium]